MHQFYKNAIMKQLFILLLLGMLPAVLKSQDLQQIGKDPFGFAGSVRMATDFYSVKGIDPRRSPSSWILSGNASFQLAGISFPFSFSFRDQQLSYGAVSYTHLDVYKRQRYVYLE